MTTLITTRNLASGWQATVHYGCSRVGGKVRAGTANRSEAFWGVTEAQAEEKAQKNAHGGSE